MKILAVICVRNEGAFLLDWLAHHRAAGVTDVVVFSNDCQDGTDAMLDRLQTMGHLTHLRNDGPYDTGGIQFTALNHAETLPQVRDADWILPCDIDEFVNVHVGAHRLPDLIDALPEATAITLTWRLFGNSDVVHFEDRPVPQQFTGAAPEVIFWPWRAAMFKTLYRNDGTYRKLGVHRPRDPDPARVNSARWFDGSGRELGPAFRTDRVYSDYGRANFDLVQLNHYPLGAMESYVVKADRGRAVHSADMLDVDYWVDRNFCTDEDRSILALAPAAEEERAALAADPTLARLHEAAVAWRRDRFQDLMRQERFRALFGRLLMTRPTRPMTPNAARYLIEATLRAQGGNNGPGQAG